MALPFRNTGAKSSNRPGAGFGVTGRNRKQTDEHHQRPGGGDKKGGAPAPVFRNQLRNQERQPDAERKARRI